jgi:hypothetical protein
LLGEKAMSARKTIFGFRINNEERELIAALADKLQRTQSDAVRLVVREAARELVGEEESKAGDHDKR